MTDHKFTLASRYIEKIRNAHKKAYAKDYYQFIREGRPEDKRPEYKNLSYMGAQAVRMELDEIMGE